MVDILRENDYIYTIKKIGAKYECKCGRNT